MSCIKFSSGTKPMNLNDSLSARRAAHRRRRDRPQISRQKAINIYLLFLRAGLFSGSADSAILVTSSR
jgi:hypothetical protein